MTQRLYNIGGSPRLLAALAITAALVLRLVLILLHDGYLGVDGGAYFLSVNTVLGDEPTNVDFSRPPLAPGWLLVPFLQLWGFEWGYKLWAFTFSMVPLLPAFALLAWKVLTPRQAAVATAFYAFDLLTAEMYVSGVLPLIGMGLFFIVLWGISRDEIKWPWQGLIIAGSLGTIAFVNHTSAGKVAIDLPVFLLAFMVFKGRRSWWPIIHSRAPVLILGAALGLLALPWYFGVAPGSEFTHFPGPWVYFAHWTDAAWIQFILVVPAAFWVVRYAPQPALRAIGIVALMECGLLVLLSNDESIINVFYRGRYFVMPFAIICWTWIVSTYWAPYLMREYKRLALTGLATLLVLSAWGFVAQFQRQTYYSDFMTPDMLKVGESLPDGRDYGVISNGFMFATWIAGVYKVPVAWVYSTAPPARFTEQYEDTKCVLGWNVDCDPIAASETIGMDYIMIDTKFPYVSVRSNNYEGAPDDPWAPLDRAEWLSLVDARGTARLYQIERR